MTHLPEELEAKILHHLRARARMWLFGGLALLAFMGAMALLAALSMKPRDAADIERLCVFGAVVALPFIAVGLRNPARARILATLRERPRSIVWLYVFKRTGNGASSYVVAGLDDGRREMLTVELGHEQDMLARLRAFLPWATVGFSNELDAGFRANPSSFRRAMPAGA